MAQGLAARLAIRIAEDTGAAPPLYGGRGTIRASTGERMEVETGNQQRTGYWVRMRRL